MYCLGSDEALDYSGATLLAMDFSIDGQKFHSKNFFFQNVKEPFNLVIVNFFEIVN